MRASGTFTTSVTVDGEKVKGKTLVIFEEIYNKDGKLVGEHRNLQDNLQTIVVPVIGTKATPENALKNEEEQNYDASSAKAGEFTVSGIKVDSRKLTGKKLVVFEEITVQEEGDPSILLQSIKTSMTKRRPSR